MIADVNVELLDELAKEQLAGKLILAQEYLEESGRWATLGERQRYDDALYNANKFMGEISIIIHPLIDQDEYPDEDDGQST